METLLSERPITAILLISSIIIFTVGGMLYTGRAIWKWPVGQTAGFLRWERGFVILATLANLCGMVLLENMLRAAGESIISRLALVTYLVGTVVLIAAEMSYLHAREWVYTQIVFYVILAFLAQAAFGAALLRTGLVAGWAGWATIIWNVVWLVVLSIAVPHNMYFPALHHVAPFIIGLALLIRN